MKMLDAVLPHVLPRAVTHEEQFGDRHASALSARHQRLRHHGPPAPWRAPANRILPFRGGNESPTRETVDATSGRAKAR